MLRSARHLLAAWYGCGQARLQSWPASSLQTHTSSAAPSLLPPHCTQQSAACAEELAACPRLTALLPLSRGLITRTLPRLTASSVDVPLGCPSAPFRRAATAPDVAAVGTERSGMCAPLPPFLFSSALHSQYHGTWSKTVLWRTFVDASPARCTRRRCRQQCAGWQERPLCGEDGMGSG